MDPGVKIRPIATDYFWSRLLAILGHFGPRLRPFPHGDTNLLFSFKFTLYLNCLEDELTFPRNSANVYPWRPESQIKMLFRSPTFDISRSVFSRLRPYHVENTRSRPISEVKLRRAQLVLTWVTGWEY